MPFIYTGYVRHKASIALNPLRDDFNFDSFERVIICHLRKQAQADLAGQAAKCFLFFV